MTQEEDVDSEDEWDSLCDITNPDTTDPRSIEALLQDKAFVERIASRLEETSKQTLEGMLEGASRLRLVLHVINNLLAYKGFADLLTDFCHMTKVPMLPLDVLSKMKDNSTVKEQAWFVQILTDLVSVMAAYVMSDVAIELNIDRLLYDTNLAMGSKICVRCPFDYGILDGLLLLLCQFLSIDQTMVSRYLIEMGVWELIWHRLMQTLGVQEIPQNPALPKDDEDDEGDDDDEQVIEVICNPEWNLVSPSGLAASLQVILIIFTKEPYHCVPPFCNANGMVMLTLSSLLSHEFLAILASSESKEQNLSELVLDIVLHVCQLLCFPFALDTHEMMMSAILSSFRQCLLVEKLVSACQKYVPLEMTEVPMGVLSRLVLSEEAFLTQFCECVTKFKAESYLSSLLSSDAPTEVRCDMLSICSHLARSGAHHLMLLKAILSGEKAGSYQALNGLLTSKNQTVKSRACGLMGNMMRHSPAFYSVLRKNEDLLAHLIAELSSNDADIRRSSSYAIGNAAYHSGDLYDKLAPVIPVLVQLLSDPVTRIRTNAAGQ
eukprot:XP_011661504.1 PREDICTED: serine/threonine-protein kinase 36 [Strongylocentrotus purpuratus]